MQQDRSTRWRHDWAIDLKRRPAANGENRNQKQCDQRAQGSSVEVFSDCHKVARVQGLSGTLDGFLGALRASAVKSFYSPSQSAYGFIDSTWSNTILIAPVIGMASTNPMAPQTAPQNSSAIVTASGLSLRRFPSSLG